MDGQGDDRRAVNIVDQTGRFDYASVPEDHRKVLRDEADHIRAKLIGAAVALMEVGERLHRARELLPHGMWLQWVTSETGMSDQWSRNCIDVYLRFRENPKLFQELNVALAPTAVVRLATASDAAYQHIIERVQTGERLRVVDVESAIRSFRANGDDANQPSVREVKPGEIAIYQVKKARPIILDIADFACRVGQELKDDAPNVPRIRQMVAELNRKTAAIQMVLSDYLTKREIQDRDKEKPLPSDSDDKN